jgi:hypothetical protein
MESLRAGQSSNPGTFPWRMWGVVPPHGLILRRGKKAKCRPERSIIFGGPLGNGRKF